MTPRRAPRALLAALAMVAIAACGDGGGSSDAAAPQGDIAMAAPDLVAPGGDAAGNAPDMAESTADAAMPRDLRVVDLYGVDLFGDLAVATLCGNGRCDAPGDCMYCPDECKMNECGSPDM